MDKAEVVFSTSHFDRYRWFHQKRSANGEINKIIN
jgi:hypothetical protein